MTISTRTAYQGGEVLVITIHAGGLVCWYVNPLHCAERELNSDIS